MDGLTDLVRRGHLDARLRREIQAQYFNPPAIPTGLSVTSVIRTLADGTSVADVQISWNVDRQLLYDVRIERQGGNPEVYSDETISPLVVMAMPTDVAFDVYVRAKHPISGFVSDWTTGAAHTTVKDTTAPAAPTGLAASVVPGLLVIKLTWNANSEADLFQYIIYRGLSTDPTTELVRVYATTYFDNQVTKNVTYYYRLKAVDRTGNLSGYTATVNATP